MLNLSAQRGPFTGFFTVCRHIVMISHLNIAPAPSRLKLDQFSGVQNRPRIQFLSMYSSSLASSCGAESRKPSNTEDTQGKEDGIQNLELDWALFVIS
ncbi:hypothetical protein OUZ56_017711 [Daphnia magna]|uniref:Uncharacterized protein n=1 Tax=Daphnia magna TaxID=35525 RepID=A0ABR0ATJ0_9CRUS|nr:hypothetical protein OUZ56_017711 [Daphnia magna]